MMRLIPKIILAGAILLDVLLCGFSAGTILVAAGVTFYQSQIAEDQVTPEGLSYRAAAPTYVPVPTFTPLPTYTSYPTYTPAPPMPAQATAPSAELQQMSIPTELAGPAAADMEVTYIVQAGDTLDSIAESYGLTPEQIITANNLDPNNPQIEPGNALVIPPVASETPVIEQNPTPESTAATSYPVYPAYPYPSAP